MPSPEDIRGSTTIVELLKLFPFAISRDGTRVLAGIGCPQGGEPWATLETIDVASGRTTRLGRAPGPCRASSDV